MRNVFIGIPSATRLVSGVKASLATDGIEVKHNVMTQNFGGLVVDNAANHVHHNDAYLNFYFGTDFNSTSADNVFHDNDFRYNGYYLSGPSDCIDDSTGSLSEGTANNWYDNLGNYNDPEYLCTETGIPSRRRPWRARESERRSFSGRREFCAGEAATAVARATARAPGEDQVVDPQRPRIVEDDVELAQRLRPGRQRQDAKHGHAKQPDPPRSSAA